MKIVGVIPDTHGLVRSEAVEALRGSELLIHAGDVGDLQQVKALEKLGDACGSISMKVALNQFARAGRSKPSISS